MEEKGKLNAKKATMELICLEPELFLGLDSQSQCLEERSGRVLRVCCASEKTMGPNQKRRTAVLTMCRGSTRLTASSYPATKRTKINSTENGENPTDRIRFFVDKWPFLICPHNMTGYNSFLLQMPSWLREGGRWEKL